MSHLRCDVTALLTLVIRRLQAILLQYYGTLRSIIIGATQNAVLLSVIGALIAPAIYIFIYHSWVLLTGL